MDKRFKQLVLENLTPEQPLGEAILKVSSIGLHGPYNPLLRSPKLGQLRPRPSALKSILGSHG